MSTKTCGCVLIHHSFRWVECQFKALQSCPTSKTHFNSLLASLPRNLEDTYERILLNIDKALAEDARRVLTLLCTAARPLTTLELIHATAVELGDNPQFNKDRILEGDDEILKICPSLLEFGQNSNVRIDHYSVQEYLESDRITGSLASQFHFERRAANTEVARTCLTYMTDPEVSELVEQFVVSPKDKQQGELIVATFPLVQYASSNWRGHYRLADMSRPHLHSLVLQLHYNSKNVCDPLLFFRCGPGEAPIFKSVRDPIHAAADKGLELVRSSHGGEVGYRIL